MSNQRETITVDKEELETVLDVMYEYIAYHETISGHAGSTREVLQGFTEKYKLLDAQAE